MEGLRSLKMEVSWSEAKQRGLAVVRHSAGVVHKRCMWFGDSICCSCCLWPAPIHLLAKGATLAARRLVTAGGRSARSCRRRPCRWVSVWTTRRTRAGCA